MIADEAIFADGSAPLLEITSPREVWEFWPLCQEAAFIRPTVLTVQTLAEPERWPASMSESLTGDPDNAGLKLCWRP